MITVKCLNCQAKLKAKEELAGRNVRCPRCKKVVGIPEVPIDDATLPPHPGAAVSDDVTAAPSCISPEPAREESVSTSGHLRIQTEIARGGMGAIMRAFDEDIQREVAVKFLLNASDARQKARFVEEAQITGQLEHPNIVPIHQLGVHEDGRCYFSMKMVKGRSLAEILKDESSESLTRLLTIFISICNAMAFAHSRKVIHRDLKPANIMVGDFGEVYVMDWGLAKVMSEPEAFAAVRRDISQSVANSSNSAVAIATTTRQTGGDLTQAGSIMGTPAYMPPEQASGEAVDERADIYSLGAILYEMMTRTPPPNRCGDIMALLLRVIEGKIDPPEVRTPERAKAGLIPPELSAIAMKALARDRNDRYPSVEALQKDIQLFQEGRSVSAKHDSPFEVIKKLVRRNRAVSWLGAGSLALLLAVAGYFLTINYETNRVARRELEEKEKRTREAVPALIQAAHLNVERQDLETASTQVNLALDYAPDNAEGRLLKAQLLIARKQFTPGVVELDEYLKSHPDNAETKLLRELCTIEHPEETSNLLKITSLFVRQKVSGLAEKLLSDFGPNLPEARKQLLAMYRTRLEKGWPGWGSRLTLDNSGLFRLSLKFSDQVTTLEPVRGIPISTLEILAAGTNNFPVNDLSPLQGMPLTSLKLYSCPQIRDLGPLQGMLLETLVLGRADLLTDISPLRGMPLVSLQFKACKEISDISSLQGMPLILFEAGQSGSLVDTTPLAGMKLTSISLARNVLANRESMKVLRQMTTLKTLWFSGHGTYSSEDFWKRYDAGEFKK